ETVGTHKVSAAKLVNWDAARIAITPATPDSVAPAPGGRINRYRIAPTDAAISITSIAISRRSPASKWTRSSSRIAIVSGIRSSRRSASAGRGWLAVSDVLPTARDANETAAIRNIAHAI